METESDRRSAVIETLVHKSNLKQRVSDNTFTVFNDLKEILHEMSAELGDELENRIDKHVRIEYRDRGKFEAQIQVAEDTLIFVMHTDVFGFAGSDPIWRNPYVSGDRDNAYCGMISVYDFLADSFRYNRAEDEGYLIGRIFVNRDLHYFVEGKEQLSVRREGFGSAVVDRGALIDIIWSAVYYALRFDLLVPPYDKVKIVTLDQFNTKMENSKFITGKRLGFEYDTKDV